MIRLFLRHTDHARRMTQELYFGIWLAGVRKQRSLTQADLSELIDRSVDAISNIERGKSLPSYEFMAELSKVLHIDPSMMFSSDTRDLSRQKHKLLAQLSAVAGQLDEKDLVVAVAQIEALANKGL